MKIEFQTVDLDKLIKFYTEGFEFKGGETLFDYESFVDTSKNKVVLRLTIKEKEE